MDETNLLTAFTEQLPNLLDYINHPSGLFGDMNIHFDNPLQSLTKQTLVPIILSKSLIMSLIGAVI